MGDNYLDSLTLKGKDSGELFYTSPQNMAFGFCYLLPLYLVV